MKGWVYIITNKSMPDLVKVGYTTKDPEKRANELYSTGVPHRYVVEYEALVDNPYRIEQKAHKLLKDYIENKEWFRCNIIRAVAAIRQAANNAIMLESVKFSFEESNIVEVIQQEIGKFIAQNGIATDTETGLMWLRFTYGQKWIENNAISNAKKIKWDDALSIPAEFNQKGYAGYNDWRLPTKDELITLVDKNKGTSANYIDSNVFPKSKTSYWSSTPYAYNSKYAWSVFFSNGCNDWNLKSNNYYVRLMRDGK